MIPFLRSLEKCFHICQIVISYPTTDVFRQAVLQPRLTFAVTALGNGFQFAKELLLTLLVHSDHLRSGQKDVPYARVPYQAHSV